MRTDRQLRMAPTGDDLADISAALDAGFTNLLLGAGDWSIDVSELTDTTADSIQPPTGTTIRGEHGTVIGWDQTGPYWPVFVLIDKTDVTIADLVFEHAGDYLTEHPATANMWGRTAFYDARTQHYVIAATGADRLTLHNIRSTGATRADNYGGLLYIHGSTDLDASKLHIEDHCTAILTGSDVSGTIEDVWLDYQSTKSGIHYGPGHGIYCFSDNVTVRNVHDEGNVSQYESYGDGATIKWKTGGATDRSNVDCRRVFSKRDAGLFDVFGLRGSHFEGSYENLTSPHPGFADAQAAVAFRSGGGEVTAAETTFDVSIRIADGDVTALSVNGSNINGQARINREVDADDYSTPWVWMRGTRNDLSLTLYDRTGQSSGNSAPLVQLDGATNDSVITIRERSGFRTAGPKFILSDVAASGSKPSRNRIDVASPNLPRDGMRLGDIELLNSITLAEALTNDFRVDGRPSFIHEAGTTATSVDETFPSGLRPGMHLVAMTLQSDDGNHSVAGLLSVIFDDRATDWTQAVIVGAWTQKGTSTNTPTSPSVSIDNAGQFSVAGTRSGTVPLNFRWSSQPLIGLDGV